MRVLLVWAILLAAALPAMPVESRPVAVQYDQERARGEREQGRILGYDVIMRRATAAVPGRVVGQSLDRAAGERYVYRLRILQQDGNVVSVTLDAHTGEIMAIRGRR